MSVFSQIRCESCVNMTGFFSKCAIEEMSLLSFEFQHHWQIRGAPRCLPAQLDPILSLLHTFPLKIICKLKPWTLMLLVFQVYYERSMVIENLKLRQIVIFLSNVVLDEMLSAKCHLLFGIFLIVQHKERPLYHVHMVTSFDCST